MHRSRFFLIVLSVLLCTALVVPVALAKKKKKRKKGQEEAPPPVGKVEVGKWSCYGPPDFAGMNNSNRRMARSDALVYLQELVNGQLMPGFKLDGESLTYFESAFLGRPQLLDDWLGENFSRCQQVGKGSLKPTEYQSWLASQGRELEEGECYKPLTYEYHNFLDIQSGWQFRLHVCQGDQVLVETTGEENGQYTLQDTGKAKNNKYITTAGDADMPEAGDAGLVAEFPAGSLVMRFESEDESYTRYFYMGSSSEWKAEEHGYISFAINDTTYFDNKFRNVRGAIDYLSLDIYPKVDEGGSVEQGLVP